MSGKKSWEVAQVLDQAESVRGDIFNSYKNTVDNGINTIETINSKIKSSKEKISAYKLENIENIGQELPIELANTKNKLKVMQDDVSKLTTCDTLEFKKQLNNINSAILSLNDVAKKLRSSLQINSGHYKDDEFNQANQIKKDMEIFKEQYRDLKSRVETAKNKTIEINKMTLSKSDDLEYIQEDILFLNKKADTIRKIRSEANALMKNILDSFRSIDIEKAQKFTSENFHSISIQVNTFNSLSNEEIISKHSSLSAQIDTIKSNYTQAYNDWLAKKNYSEELYKNTLSNGNKEELILIEDKVAGKNNFKSKFAYYDNYKKTKTLIQFNDILARANQLFANEEFEICNQTLEEAKNLYEKISNEADDLRENIEATANLAMKIRQIMLSDEINFKKAHLEIIDDNPINGFRLECQNGDTVNFEKINIEKDAVVIDLDHIENTGGTCGVRWEDMQKVFNEKGIPLVDVKKDGKSVIYRDVRADKKNEQTRQRDS